MAEEKRSPSAAGKLGKATATGDAEGRGSFLNIPSPDASEGNDGSALLSTLQLHPVKLKTDFHVEIPPCETAELWGPLSRSAEYLAALRVLPRSKEWLPAHVEVMDAELVHLPHQPIPQVRLVLRNTSTSSTAMVSSRDVLAELHLSDDSAYAGDGTIETLEALVGPCCESPISINGTAATCLIDSGSQVTVVSESFYRKFLKNVCLEQLDTALDITSAEGQLVPYLGVVKVSVELPEHVGGTFAEVSILAVVVRTHDSLPGYQSL